MFESLDNLRQGLVTAKGVASQSGDGFKTVIAAQIDPSSAKFEDNIATMGRTLKIPPRGICGKISFATAV